MASKHKSVVDLDPMPIKKNSRVTIHYHGSLPILNGKKVYLHYGFGTNGEWKHVGQREMNLSPKGYTTALSVNGDERLNLCFHDEQGHWDNNMGNNWCYEFQ